MWALLIVIVVLSGTCTAIRFRSTSFLLNEILSCHGKEIRFCERITRPPVIEGEGEGNIVPGRTETPTGEVEGTSRE